jgi:hypothetical protein
MSKADISTTPIRSRRTVLVGIASAAALPIVGTLPTPTEAATDPIFPAIDEFQRANAAWSAAFGAIRDNENVADEIWDRRDIAEERVIKTSPTSPAGLVALTTWVRERLDWLRDNGSCHEPEKYCAMASAIDDAARGMSGLKRWSPVADGGKNTTDPIFAIIDRHQAITTVWREAVRVEFAFEKNRSEVEAMNLVERKTYQSTFDSIQEATEDASDQMHEASVGLLNNPPSSLAGIVALCEYVGPQLDDDEHNLPDEIEWEDGTQSTVAGAFANSIRSAVAAMVQS